MVASKFYNYHSEAYATNNFPGLYCIAQPLQAVVSSKGNCAFSDFISSVKISLKDPTSY